MTPTSPVDQLKRDFETNPVKEIDIISIYNDGSFFADSEISQLQRTKIAELIGELDIPNIIVESLPQFVTPDRISPFLEKINSRLTIGIGIQSANDFVRQVCVGTSFTLRQFEAAVSTANSLGVGIKPYVMIKPPFLSEAEALTDVRLTVRYLSGMGVNNATLCPTRIAPNTLVEKLYKNGAYSVPDPYTVLAALRNALEWLDARIALVNLTAEDFSSVTSTSKRTNDAQKVLDALKGFSLSGDRTKLMLPEPYESAYREHCFALEAQEETDIRVRTKLLLDELESYSV